jgi:hypothetical protein
VTDRNRIQERIRQLEARIKSGEIEQGKLDELDKQLATEAADLIEYQNLQAQAYASGKLSFAEADLIYRALGRESPSTATWDNLPLATRVAITQVMAELLDWKIGVGSSLQDSVAGSTRLKQTKRAPRRRETSPEGIQVIGGR